MSLHIAAQHLASKGRKGDTELVHMTKGEIKGLQDLALAHGGSLSINPDTGLVEASFLKKMLPMIAGIGLNMMFPGLGALATAGIVGGVETVRTGDIGKGLMAGLGAYGGAGIGQGLSSAAGAAATETAAANALGAGANVGTGATSQAGMLAAENASMGLTPIESAANITSSGGYAAGATPMSMGAQSANLMASGIENIATNPVTAGKAAYAGMPIGTVPALGTTVANAMTPEVAPLPGEKKREYPEGSFLSSDFQAYVPRRPNPYYRPTGLGYAAQGGSTNDIMMAAGGSYDDEAMGDDTAMAAGGSIGGYSDGGRMLKGPGDGMSDSIPGVIGNKQPARLADGEFVVPADVVSHLGNGSTDAGAKRLYAMMDKVRHARTGKKKQAPAVKASKYMPA
jgi:hypothetical protein